MPINAYDPVNSPASGQAPGSAARAARPGKPRILAWWLLRIYCTAQAAGALWQLIFSSRFLPGDSALLAAHPFSLLAAGVLAASEFVVALLAWQVFLLPRQIVLAFIAAGLAGPFQIAAGFAGLWDAGVPLGMAFTAISCWLWVWMWTHPARSQVGT
jgi:hypothetical protein